MSLPVFFILARSGKLFRVIRQCLVHFLAELLFVWVVFFLCGSHFASFSWIHDHVYQTSLWKAAIASSMLLVTKLERNQVYILMESIYANIVAPVILGCLGVMSMDNALVCLRNMSIPIVIIVGVRALDIRDKRECIDNGANVGEAGGIGSPKVSISENFNGLKEWASRKWQQRLHTSVEQTS